MADGPFWPTPPSPARQGENLGRDGKLHFVLIGREDGSVYLFDIPSIGPEAFGRGGGLRALLENAGVAKLMYDCRHDADALFHLCGGTRIAGAIDLQVRLAIGMQFCM